MEKNIMNIKLADGPIRGNDKRKNNPNRGGFNHRTKGLNKINTSKLVITFCNKAAFPLFQ